MNQIQSDIIALRGVGNSMQGGRPENQDDWGFVDTPLGFLLVVCDGMGGGPGGKTASYIVKNEFMAALHAASPQASPVDAMKMAVSRANDAVYQMQARQPKLRGMGSTLVAVLISPRSALVAHLGDSRCYRVSDGRIVFRTQDHSLVGELVRSKALTEEEARTSPQSNVIMRALGNTDNHVAEIEEVPYAKGDRFLLCTDGVWGIMPHEQLAHWLTSREDMPSLVQRLSAEIDRLGMAGGGHHDNHTLAVVEMQTDSILKDNMNKKLKTILCVFACLLAVSLVFNFVGLARMASQSELQAQLAASEAQLQEQKSEMALYQGVKDSDTKDLITKVEVLEYEKQLLLETQATLIAKVDSLENVVAQLHQRSSSSPSPKSAAVGASARELAQRTLNLFAALTNAKGSDIKTATRRQVEYKQKIQAALVMLDKKTGGQFKSTIDGINRQLQADQVIGVMYNEKAKGPKEFVTSNAARKEIERLTKKVRDIQSKIKE